MIYLTIAVILFTSFPVFATAEGQPPSAPKPAKHQKAMDQQLNQQAEKSRKEAARAKHKAEKQAHKNKPKTQKQAKPKTKKGKRTHKKENKVEGQTPTVQENAPGTTK